MHRIPWESFFQESVLKSGKKLYEDEGIHHLSCNETNIGGRFRKQGHVRIKMFQPARGRDRSLQVIALSINCTCADLRFACEHAAALFYYYMEVEDFPAASAKEISLGRAAEDFIDRESLAIEYESDHLFFKRKPKADLDEEDDMDDDDEDDDLLEDFDDDDDEDATSPRNHSRGLPKQSRQKTQRSISGSGAGSSKARKAKVVKPPDLGEAPPKVPLAQTIVDHDHPAWKINLWLDEHDERHFSPRDQQLSYHLHRTSTHDHYWSCEVVAARRLKSGAWGVLRRFDHLEQILRLDLPYVTPEDIRLVRRLVGLQDPRHMCYRGAVLSGVAGATGELMERLIVTGRCYVEDFQHPLSQGQPLRVTGVWVQEKNLWRVSLKGEDGVEPVLIETDPPYYVADGKGGPILGFNEQQVRMLSDLPSVPHDLMGSVSARLRTLIPTLSAPELSDLQPEIIIPTGHLERWTPTVTMRMDGMRVPVECVLFLVRYADALIEPNSRGPVQIGGRKGTVSRSILRDRSREEALTAQLRQLGLVPTSELQQETSPYQWWDLPQSKIARPWVHRVSALESTQSQRILLPMTVVAALSAAGWTIAGTGAPPALLSVGTIEARLNEDTGNDWFRLDLGVKLGEERVDLTPILADLMAAGGVSALQGVPQADIDGCKWVCLGLPDGRVIRVPFDLLQRLIEHLTALFDTPPGPGGWKTDPWQAMAFEGFEGVDANAGPRLRELVRSLAELTTATQSEPPAGLTAELRPYQKEGLAWMQRLRAAGIGGLLADDMGLGKTIQAIAHICMEADAGRLTTPALVVAPASMVGTWKRELGRFAPALRVEVLHGAARTRDRAVMLKAQVVVTTYATLLRDVELAGQIEWSVLIADEAQSMANPAVKSGHAVRQMRAGHRMALTGTPLSNHLGELHTLLAWLVPGLLGSAARFERAFRRPIEQSADKTRSELLRRRIAPFLLRRTKEKVAPELPPRTESIVTVELESGQRALYESVRLAMDERIHAVIAAKGLARSRIEVLEALSKLRMCCCDPRLVKLKNATGQAGLGSAKLSWLTDTLPQLIEEGRRVLLFSQFTSWLDLVESDVLTPLMIPWARLDGSTIDRDAQVQRFQSQQVPVFLLSLKAGGTGLTLTAADTVIIADPWWNPAAEAQAADRAHRIGQDKPVFVWRLVAGGTVEERILALQARKRNLMAAMLDEQGQALPGFSEEDLAALLAPLPD